MNYFIIKLIIVNFFIPIFTAQLFAPIFDAAIDQIVHFLKKPIDYYECCDSQWITNNLIGLEYDFENRLYGQHLVKIALMKHLKEHILTENPHKALLFSFNGMTGTGKTFVSTMIANRLYKNGRKSKYVHVFLPDVHFLNKNKLDEYKETLQKKIINAVKQCPRSLFIFDEVHNMPGDLLDVIMPFVDYHELIDGVDYRKAIFILLSNSGGKEINTKLLQAYNNGRIRESLTFHEMEEALIKPLYEMKNDGLRRSKLISHRLITEFVPFLPLEKKHVVLCIKIWLKENNHWEDQKKIDRVLEKLNFANENGLEISVYGCKRLADKIKLFNNGANIEYL